MKRAALGGIGVDARWLGHQIKKLVCFSEVAPSAIGSSLKEPSLSASNSLSPCRYPRSAGRSRLPWLVRRNNLP